MVIMVKIWIPKSSLNESDLIKVFMDDLLEDLVNEVFWRMFL